MGGNKRIVIEELEKWYEGEEEITFKPLVIKPEKKIKKQVTPKTKLKYGLFLNYDVDYFAFVSAFSSKQALFFFRERKDLVTFVQNPRYLDFSKKELNIEAKKIT